MGGNIVPAQTAARILRDRYKVEIHCIGIGAEMDRNVLQGMASRPLSEHVFLLKDYGEMHLLAQTITKQKLGELPLLCASYLTHHASEYI